MNKHFSILRLLLAVLMVLVVTNVSYSQTSKDQTQEATVEQTPEDKPTAPEKVDVKPVARDAEIETRLNDILIATQWFKNPSVKVDDGVVFLTGEATQEEYKAWASDLASNTQDVAAVVNRMGVTAKSIWDFSAAFAELRDFRTIAIQAIPLILFALVILALTWLAAELAGRLANRVFSKRIPNTLLRWVTTRAITLPILIFGFYLVLRVSGLTQLALTVLGGTGLIGLVLGIAFQDIAENFLASILISIQKPFRIGDMILIDGHQGIVQRVTTRGTTLLTADGNHVQIPNSKIYKTTIENYTANPLRRLSFDIGVGYDDSASEAQKIVLDKLKEHSATINDPPPKVLIESLGAATVNLRALFWIDGIKNDWQSVRSSCMRIAKQALLKSGISLPDEAREVIFPNGVPVLMHDSSSAHSNRSLPNGSTQSTAESKENVTVTKTKNSTAKIHQDDEQDSSEAEGNMQSEIDDLKRQGEKSWLPGEGDAVLVGEE